MLRYLSALPFALPALVVGIVVSAFVARWLAKRIGEHQAPVFLWLASAALILSATLTPPGHAIEAGVGVLNTRVWIWALPSPSALFSVNWQSMNLLLFAPLGFSSSLFARHRRVVWFGSLAFLMSALVEIAQFLVTPLGRPQFNSATVLIGWAGISIGLIVGVLASAQVKRASQRIRDRVAA